MKLEDRDFGMLCICSERYALGRRTYMPSLVCGIIKDNLDELTDADISVLIDDIEHPLFACFNDNVYGDACDKKTWMNMLDVLKTEKCKRNKEKT